MDISAISSIGTLPLEQLSQIGIVDYKEGTSFQDVLEAAMNMVVQTNDLQNDADAETIRFALGQAENSHDMQVAATKALTAIQYTTAIRDKVLDAYKEIMNMQI